RVAEPPAGGALSRIAEAGLTRPDVDERPAENSPCLRASPRAVVTNAFVRVAAQHPAGGGIEGRRLTDRAVVAETELDVTRGVANRNVAQGGVAGLAVCPEQQRGRLHGVDIRLSGADVGGLFGGRAQGQRLSARVVGRCESARPGQREFARRRVAAEQRAEGGAVIKEKAAEYRVGL